MSHAVTGVALSSLLAAPATRSRLMLGSAFCAMLPDADVFGFALGISYGDVLGHRGFTHSLAFALLPALAGWAWLKSTRVAACLGLATLSHGLLDALTDGGRGVGFLIPFSAERYFFPWRPIEVSPIGFGFFSARGLSVFTSELLWIWLPSFALLAALWLARRRTHR